MEIGVKPPVFAPSPHAQSMNHAQNGVNLKPDELGDKDTVDLSANANEIRKMVQKINELPDVREDKVAELKRRIADGTYKILNEKAATHLIEEAMENNTILNRIDTTDD